mmetsp:Transcript_304/g.857  ORF Transcript_304/g.857 Transcript_304/m.857 type:complete len:518 (-) Transcript_304:285-1838(-)
MAPSDPSGAPQDASASSSAAAASKDVSDVLEERLIDAEYKIWKKNTPYLYDFVMTHSLEWPSLTCQWLPTVKNAGPPSSSSGGESRNAEEHSLLLGTHTTGEQNYLMVVGVNLPKSDTVIDNRTGDGASAADKAEGETSDEAKKSASSSSSSSEPAAPAATTVSANYDDEKNELGGFGTSSGTNPGTVGKIEVRMKVKHEGEVNRARHMPQNHFVVASRGPNPEVYIWDLSRHPSFPDENSPFAPQGVCVGHAREGYGLAWSTHDEGRLVSGSEDATVCLFDVNSVVKKTGPGSESGAQIPAVSTFAGHTDVVEDVDWHRRDPNLVGSVGDDRCVMVWDAREKNPTKPVHAVRDAHRGDINSISFNPVNEFLAATGSADKTVKLWDMRNLKAPMQTFEGHTDQVYSVSWAPHNESILASCSADRRVGIWDLSRIGMEQSPEDAEDGPPEMLFLHGGHTSKVSDFSWNANDEWTIASVSEDNVLQVWNMAEEIYADEDEDAMSTGEGEDAVLKDDELE